MNQDDPFAPTGDDGATVIRPTPGGRRAAGGAPAAPWPPAPPPGTGVGPGPGANWPPPPPPPPPRVPAPGPLPAAAPAGGVLPAASIDNPLTACAGDLLAVAGELRGSAGHGDPDGLRERLTAQVRAFENCARVRGLTDTVVLPARYVLCALIDESIRDTPWGSQSSWNERGLLLAFHNETWGGEKFFDALERLLAYPAGNLHLLELMYLCLAQGFEGRYRVRAGGQDQLEQVRANLYQAIRAQRGDPERDLSPHWRGVAPRTDPLIQQVPLWVLSALAAALLLGLYAAFTFALSRDSDPVYADLAALDRGLPLLAERNRPPPPPPPAPPPAPGGLTLRGLLADDIRTDRLAVEDRPAGQTIIIRGEGLFASGQARLVPSVEDLVQRIGDALKQLPGPVLITGHSDSAPIKSLRFPSNWHLSNARAEEVARRLGALTGDPARFRAEGRADTEPAVPSNPRDARNRRVEITLARTANPAVLPDATAPGTPADTPAAIRSAP